MSCQLNHQAKKPPLLPERRRSTVRCNYIIRLLLIAGNLISSVLNCKFQVQSSSLGGVGLGVLKVKEEGYMYSHLLFCSG